MLHLYYHCKLIAGRQNVQADTSHVATCGLVPVSVKFRLSSGFCNQPVIKGVSTDSDLLIES
ncbi:hypothetical protein BDR07DRAFT_1428471 [Suillus spraguei]|nr:hypothetical protein BDR07DRAFT_1428471 [Suillus spraguei]